MTGPNIAPATLDPQRDAVYSAEAYAQECSDEPRHLDAGELDAFAARALTGAGWSGTAAPVFVLDVTDESEFTGWHEACNQVIHLHPRLLTPWHVLHELAHWVDPRDGHGPRFCANIVGLVHAGIGPEAAAQLLTTFEDDGVDVDRAWLDEVD